jgi:hypothetical protein
MSSVLIKGNGVDYSQLQRKLGIQCHVCNTSKPQSCHVEKDALKLPLLLSNFEFIAHFGKVPIERLLPAV